MFDLTDCELSEEVTPSDAPKHFLLSMAHHLVRSLLTRKADDLSLLVVLQNKKAAEEVKEVISRMNSMGYDHRLTDVFIAKSSVPDIKKTLVMTDTQDHQLFSKALNSGNDTRPTIIIVQGELQSRSVLAELAAKREAECFYLI